MARRTLAVLIKRQTWLRWQALRRQNRNANIGAALRALFRLRVKMTAL